MSTIITMPQKGLTEESAVIAHWNVKKGDAVKKGDSLFEIEIGKATFDVESEAEGTVLEIFCQEGDDVAIMAPVCVIGAPGETYDLPKTEEKKDAAPAEAAQTAPVQPMAAAVTAQKPGAGAVAASPRARAAAARCGLDISAAVPTGAEGRVIERDVEALRLSGPYRTDVAGAADIHTDVGSGVGGRVRSTDAARPAAAAPQTAETGKETAEAAAAYELRPLSNMRRIIAENMHRSLADSAQLTISMSFDATAILEYRKKVKADGERQGVANISLNDMVVFAASRVLMRYPELNAHYTAEGMKLFRHANLGIAVDTERGLMVPTVFEAEHKSLNAISLELKELAEKCRSGSVRPEQLSGGTFTLSNLGSFGVTSFTPVINPPQTALLGVCALEWKVAPDKTGAPRCYQAMGLSLTIDHRAIDGAPGARFLRELCQALENFELLLAQ